MISQILLAAKKDPTITVGGILKAIDGNLRVGKSDVFISEACEYTNSFFVKGDISRIKIEGITHTVGNDLWSESLYDLLIVLNFAVDDNGTIFFCIFCK